MPPGLTLTGANLKERGLGHLFPITMDELHILVKRPDWGEPREEPGEDLLRATEAAVERTKALLAAEKQPSA